MIRDAGDRFEVSVPMTLANASGLLAAGKAMLGQGDKPFDLGAVEEVDSSGLAVVFGWLRAATRQGAKVRLVNPPADLLSLAKLYGVSEFLPSV